MNPLDPMSPDNLTKLERRLVGWQPAPAASGRDRLLFEAGIAAGRRQARRQAAVFGLILMIGSGLWIDHEHRLRSRLEIALADRPSAPERVPVNPAPTPGPTLAATLAAPSSYLALSHRYGRGVDPLDPVEPGVARPVVPAPDGPILTPLSGRRSAGFSEL